MIMMMIMILITILIIIIIIEVIIMTTMMIIIVIQYSADSNDNNNNNNINDNNNNNNNNNNNDNNDNNNNNNDNNNNDNNNNAIVHLWQRVPRTSSAVCSCEAWCTDAAVAVCLIHTGSCEMTGAGCALVYICKLLQLTPMSRVQHFGTSDGADVFRGGGWKN